MAHHVREPINCKVELGSSDMGELCSIRRTTRELFSKGLQIDGMQALEGALANPMLLTVVEFAEADDPSIRGLKPDAAAGA